MSKDKVVSMRLVKGHRDESKLHHLAKRYLPGYYDASSISNRVLLRDIQALARPENGKDAICTMRDAMSYDMGFLTALILCSTEGPKKALEYIFERTLNWDYVGFNNRKEVLQRVTQYNNKLHSKGPK